MSDSSPRPWFVPTVLCLIGAAVFLRDLLFTDQMAYFRDFYFYIYPNLDFWAQSVGTGEWPFWNPYIQGGTPFWADPTTACFYPPHLIFLAFDFPNAAKVFIWLHLALALGSTYYLARVYGISRTGAAVAAITLAFSGYMVSMVSVFTKLRGLPWIPLVLAWWKVGWDRKHWGYLAGAGGALAMVILAGHLYAAYFTGLFLVIDGLVLRRNEESWAWRGWVLVAVLGWAGGISAVQSLPTVLYKKDSIRKDGIDPQSLSRWWLAPQRIPELAMGGIYGVEDHRREFLRSSNPQGLWATSIYFGLFSFVLGGSFLIAGRGRERRFLLVILGVAFVLALGRLTPIFEGARTVLPFFSGFRYPEKFVFWITLVFALAAGKGFDHWFPSEKMTQAKLALPVLATLALVGWWVLSPPPIADLKGPMYSIDSTGLVRFFLLAAILAVLLWGRKKSLWWGLALVVILVADLDRINRREIPLLPTSLYRGVPETVQALPSTSLDGPRVARYPRRGFIGLTTTSRRMEDHLVRLGRDSILGNLAMVYQFPHGGGMSPASLWRYREFTRTLDGNRRWFDLLGIRYIMSEGYSPPLPPDMVLQEIFPNHLGWYENRSALGRAKIYFQSRSASSLEDVWAGLGEGDVSREVIWEGGPNLAGEKGTGTVEITRYSRNQVELEVHVDRPAAVVLFDGHAPGWTVEVDGEIREIHYAFGLFRGVYVEAGRHRLVMKYTPPGWYLGLAGSILSILSCLLVIGVTRWKNPS